MLNREWVRKLSGGVLLLIIAVTGCDDRHKTYPITGTVKFPDGTPLHVGQIYFETRDERYGLGIAAMGNVNEDGTFTVGVYQRDVGGAPPGMYTVYIRGAKVGQKAGVSVNERSGGKWIIKDKFRHSHTSDIRVEVKAEGENNFDIVVERP